MPELKDIQAACRDQAALNDDHEQARNDQQHALSVARRCRQQFALIVKMLRMPTSTHRQLSRCVSSSHLPRPRGHLKITRGDLMAIYPYPPAFSPHEVKGSRSCTRSLPACGGGLKVR